MKMPEIGEIHELKTPAGLAYLQYIGLATGEIGPLFRVLDGIFDEPCSHEELTHLVEKPEQFIVIFPFIGARRQGLSRKVTTIQVPRQFAGIPPIIYDERDLSGAFHIVFPSGRPPLTVHGELSEEQKKYPQAGVPAADLLGERIASGWRPRDWYEHKRWK